MRRIRQLGFVGLLLANAAVAGAQAAQIPPTPAPPSPNPFTATLGHYAFSGCFTGAVAFEQPGNVVVVGTPACVSGLLTMGLGQDMGLPPGPPRLLGWLAMSYGADARVRNVRLPEANQSVSGMLTNAACPVGCASLLFYDFMTNTGRSDSSFEATSVFVPQSVFVGVRYTVPTNAFFGAEERFASFALTAVPEPSTYALFATGLLGLAGVARRKRQA